MVLKGIIQSTPTAQLSFAVVVDVLMNVNVLDEHQRENVKIFCERSELFYDWAHSPLRHLCPKHKREINFRVSRSYRSKTRDFCCLCRMTPRSMRDDVVGGGASRDPWCETNDLCEA